MTTLDLTQVQRSRPTDRFSLGLLDQVDAKKLISAAADISLIIDRDGIIRDIAVSGEEILREDIASWLNRPWVETVTVESRTKVEELLSETRTDGAPRWRHINHPSLRGADIPIRYSAVEVGTDGRVVAVGRDLRNLATLQRRLIDAQQTMERENSKLRSSETRYKLLFQIASEAVVIIDAATDKITEANPVAERLLGNNTKKVTGRTLFEFFDASNHAQVQNVLATVRSAGRADNVEIELVDHTHVAVGASLFRQENSTHILVRLLPQDDAIITKGPARAKSSLIKVVEKMPDGFVVTDTQWRILTANSAFLDLAQLPNEEMAASQSLRRFLGRTEVELDVLGANLRDHGSVRQFATVFRSQYGTLENVEVTAVSVADVEMPCFGLTLRREAPRATNAIVAGREVPRSVEQLTGLVGRVSLKDLVRESTDLIERLAIEAALELTGDNRASAADMLGLSRQSLYVKLRRYGLGDLDSPEN